MRQARWLALSLLLLVGAGTRPAQSGGDSPPVFDLRVGLDRNVSRPGRTLWAGSGQAGIVQLRSGHVTGLLAPFRVTEPEPSSAGVAVAFARFQSELRESQAFDLRGCVGSAERVMTAFELDAPQLLAREPASVPLWVQRGVSVFSLVGTRDSALASSAFPSGPERSVGLTALGREVVRRILSAGALVDVASLSDLAVQDVLELAAEVRAPVIATRGSARAVHVSPGSFSDAQLRAIATAGGVVGLSFERSLLGDGSPIELSDVIRQVSHLLRVAGPSAVAIASGFEDGATPPFNLHSSARYPRLAQALRGAGVGEAELRRIFGENARRALCAKSPGEEI